MTKRRPRINSSRRSETDDGHARRRCAGAAAPPRRVPPRAPADAANRGARRPKKSGKRRYLAELLLEKGYVVHGIIRRSSSFNTGRIEHLYKDKHARRRAGPDFFSPPSSRAAYSADAAAGARRPTASASFCTTAT